MAPLLEKTDGVDINVYFRDHLPPHIHANYAEEEALIEIRTGEVIDGEIKASKLKVVRNWLKAGDNRAMAEKNFYELNPSLAPEAYDNTRKQTTKNKKRTK